jgi:hypothetical protein
MKLGSLTPYTALLSSLKLFTEVGHLEAFHLISVALHVSLDQN